MDTRCADLVSMLLVKDEGMRQGLTLVHFSAQPEPLLTQKHTLNTP